jgi:hypothetical protein
MCIRLQRGLQAACQSDKSREGTRGVRKLRQNHLQHSFSPALSCIRLVRVFPGWR